MICIDVLPGIMDGIVIPSAFSSCMTQEQCIAWLYAKVLELQREIEELKKKQA